MAVSLKHSFNNPKSDGPDSTVVRPSDWNAEHVLTLGTNRVLGRVSSGTGAVEELTGAQVRSIADVAQLGVLGGINTRTASYTLALSDRGKLIEMNVSSANTVTVPNESGIGGVNFPIGSQILVVQTGTGTTTVSPAAGVTIQSTTGGLTTVTRYSAVLLYKRAANNWLVIDQATALLDGRVDNLETVAGGFSNVATVATNIGSVNTAAANIAGINNVSAAINNGDLLTDVYQGAAVSDPTLRLTGAALQNGDFYFNTSTNRTRTFANGVWYDAYPGGNTNADLVAYTPAGSGAVATTAQVKLRQTVSVFDFMTSAQIADVKAGTATIDVTTPVQAALNANLGAVYFPKGTYFINPITIPGGTYVKTDGFDTVFKRNPASENGTRTIRVGGSNVEIESFAFVGDISTGTFEWNHCVFIWADATTGAISNVTIHDIYGQDIRGDIIEMGGLPEHPLKNIRVGRISGNNILRSGISILGGENIEIQSVNVTNVGYFAFNIEPDPYNEPARGVKVGYIAGKAVGVVPPNTAVYAAGVEFGTLDLHPTTYGTNSTPTYGPGGEKLTGLVLRNTKDVRIGKMSATGYKSHAIFVVYSAGELGCQDLQIDLLNVANCGSTESTYNAYVWGGSAMQRLTINALIADASATTAKAIIKDVVNVVVSNISATLSTDTSLVRGCTRAVIENAVVSGGGLLLSTSGGTVRNVQLNGELLAGYCSPMTFENVTATTSVFVFDSGNDNHVVHNSTFNSAYFAGGFFKQQHTTALRFGNNWLWVDASGKLRIRNGTAPTSDTDGTVVGTQT